jgi:hypothetical protein
VIETQAQAFVLYHLSRLVPFDVQIVAQAANPRVFKRAW